MSFRGIKRAQAAANNLRDRVDAALGYPRCERLSGTLALDGRPVPVSGVLTCPCTVVTSPDPACPYATRSEAEPVQIAGNPPYAYPVRESKANVMAQLNASERSAIVTIDDTEIIAIATAAAAAKAGV